MNLSERIKKGLEATGMNQSELARDIKVSRATVSQWLNGTVKKIESDNLLALARILKVSPLWLSKGVGPMRVEEQNAAVYEQRLSARGLRILSRLVAAEEQGALNTHVYQIIEQALMLTESVREESPILEPVSGDVLEKLTADQREALAAFIQSLTRG